MTVTLIHFIAIDSLRHRAGFDRATLRAKSHGAAHIRIGTALRHLAVAVQPFGDQRHDRMIGVQIEFGTVRIAHA